MNLRDTSLGKVYYWFIKSFCNFFLKEKDISPMIFTLLGLFFAVLVPIFFLISPLVAALFIFLSGISDSIDGHIARDTNRQTKFGAFLDSTVDRISDFFYLFGFLCLFWKNNFSNFFLFNFLILISVVFTILISYTKARIEGLGGQCDKGLMSRAVRVIYLIIWAIFLSIFSSHMELILWIGGIIYFLLVIFSVIQRSKHAYKEL